jgi:hypothetical protein
VEVQRVVRAETPGEAQFGRDLALSHRPSDLPEHDRDLLDARVRDANAQGFDVLPGDLGVR